MINNKPRVVFFGTPWIAKECLDKLNKLNVDIVGVVSQPDKELDRKKQVVFSEVKKYVIDNNFKLFQPDHLIDIYDQLKELKPDIFITCAYGQFIPDKILDIPKYKCVNIHASLLPKLRGGAPIHWAIINQEKETGITLMYTIKKMDAGNIIFQEKLAIDKNETYQTLLIKLCDLAKVMLDKYFFKLLDDNVKSIEQVESNATFGFNIKKEETFIDWNKKACEVDALIRGLNDKPVCKFIYNNVVVKVFSSEILETKSTKQPGTIINITKNGIEITTSDYNILIKEIQLPSKNRCNVSDLINGNSLDFLK